MLPAFHRRLRDRLIRSLSLALIVAGMIALISVAYVNLSARHFQTTAAAAFEKTSSPQPASPRPSSTPRRVQPGDVLAIVQIGSVGIRAVVVQGDSSAVLRHAVGHVPGTPLPGEPGNIALAAHRDTFFRPLRNLKTGDPVELQTRAGVLRYRVRSITIVPPDDVGVLAPRGRNELTLITCYPFYFVGHAPKRFIVRAEETSMNPPN